MTSRQVCLGWHWYPYGYARTVVDGDGSPVKPFPARAREAGPRRRRGTLWATTPRGTAEPRTTSR